MEKGQSLQNPRDHILKFILNNPGTHLRKIMKNVNYSMGTIQYHINNLERERKIISKRKGFYKNFYHSEANLDQNEIMSILNLESPRRIILYLLENEPCNHKKIAQGINLSSPTVSFHMKRLAELDIISIKYNGKFSIYSIKNKEMLVTLLGKYSLSTWNSMMSNMTDLFSSFHE